jgi:hypothetical protein
MSGGRVMYIAEKLRNGKHSQIRIRTSKGTDNEKWTWDEATKTIRSATDSNLVLTEDGDHNNRSMIVVMPFNKSKKEQQKVIVKKDTLEIFAYSN